MILKEEVQDWVSHKHSSCLLLRKAESRGSQGPITQMKHDLVAPSALHFVLQN